MFGKPQSPKKESRNTHKAVHVSHKEHVVDVGVNQSANDYMQNATNLDKAGNSPPTMTVPKEEGNNSPLNVSGKSKPSLGSAEWAGGGDYAHGWKETARKEGKKFRNE